jgi:Fic family protein
VLKALNGASRSLAELKGIAATIPNQSILINALSLQEAKESSAIESIVTTHDELFREPDAGDELSPAAKEVFRYRAALKRGLQQVKKRGLITRGTVLDVQASLEASNAGLRRVPGTTLRDGTGATIYTPPQDAVEIARLVEELVAFMNGQPPYNVDPLIKMALIHHQFETIHPFYDGNGRTGRILNVLYLVNEGLLDLPILYHSRAILRTKSEYYRLLQAARNADAWEAWVVYMLGIIEQTAQSAVGTVKEIAALLLKTKHAIRANHPKFYSQDLINSLFQNPYTKIEHITRDIQVSRITATKYLNALAADRVLRRVKIGRTYYYVNQPLVAILTGSRSAARRTRRKL